MKKFTLLLISVMALNVAANAEDRIIKVELLPKPAQEMLNNHFSDQKIMYVKEDRDFMDKSYEVVFMNGANVDFDSKGEWKEIDLKKEIPAEFIPTTISNYIKENYPDVMIMQIERDKRKKEIEIKLSNRLEITFDKNYNVIDIDY